MPRLHQMLRAERSAMRLLRAEVNIQHRDGTDMTDETPGGVEELEILSALDRANEGGWGHELSHGDITRLMRYIDALKQQCAEAERERDAAVNQKLAEVHTWTVRGDFWKEKADASKLELDASLSTVDRLRAKLDKTQNIAIERGDALIKAYNKLFLLRDLACDRVKEEKI